METVTTPCRHTTVSRQAVSRHENDNIALLLVKILNSVKITIIMLLCDNTNNARMVIECYQKIIVVLTSSTANNKY